MKIKNRLFILIFSTCTLLQSCLNEKTGEFEETYQVYSSTGNTVSRKLISVDQKDFILGVKEIAVNQSVIDLKDPISWGNGFGFISELDRNGIITHDYIDSLNVVYSDVQFSDESFFIVGAAKNEFLLKRLEFQNGTWKMDYQKVWKYKNSTGNFIDNIYVGESYIMLVGRCEINGKDRLYVAKTDLLGTIEWEKIYLREDVEKLSSEILKKGDYLTVLHKEVDDIQNIEKYSDYFIDIKSGLLEKVKYFTFSNNNNVVKYFNQNYLIVKQDENNKYAVYYLTDKSETKTELAGEGFIDAEIVVDHSSNQFVIVLKGDEYSMNYLCELYNGQIQLLQSYTSTNSNNLVSIKWDNIHKKRLFLLNTLLKFKYIIEVRNR